MHEVGPSHYYGVPARVNADTGAVIGQVSDPRVCGVQDIAPSGDNLCAPNGTITRLSLRTVSGSEVWAYTVTQNQPYYLEYLSPDENNVLAVGPSDLVIRRDGYLVGLPDSFSGIGWLDSTTLIGRGNSSNFSYVALSAPAEVVDIGFKGLYVGIIRD